MLSLYTLSAYICLWCFLLSDAQTPLQSYSVDTTLTLAQSPYIVNSYVTFASTANIVIENGVEIVFIDRYFISVFGGLNCGCDGSTIDNSVKGLANNRSFVHMVGNASVPTTTGLFINHVDSNNPPVVQFCNTLFERTQNGITSTQQQFAPYTVHNCEFRTINKAIYHSSAVINEIYNSHFHHINHVKSAGNAVYDNCLFEHFGKFSYQTSAAVNIAVHNSEIYGNGIQVCLNIQSVIATATGGGGDSDAQYGIYNNLISNCLDGVEVWSGVHIANNTITNCSRFAIHATTTTTTTNNNKLLISGNTFERIDTADIVLNAVPTAQIVDNHFMSHQHGDACVSATNVEHMLIAHNEFIQLEHDRLMVFNHCAVVNVTDNRFAFSTHRHGLLSSIAGVDLEISRNRFEHNTVAFVADVREFEVGGVLDVFDNVMTTQTLSTYLFTADGIDEVYIDSNEIVENVVLDSNTTTTTTTTTRRLMAVQNSNYVYIAHNVVRENTLHCASATCVLLDNLLNSNTLVAYNVFANNSAPNTNINTNTNANFENLLLQFTQCDDIAITRNRFENALHVNNFLDLSGLRLADVTTITYNDFIQTVSEVENYIVARGDSDAAVHVNFNNFYTPSNVEYFVSPNGVDADLSDNYWALSSATTANAVQYQHLYVVLLDKIQSFCVNPVLSASAFPIDADVDVDAEAAMMCTWQMTSDCQSLTQYQCEPDTMSPTAPTKPPTPAPALMVSLTTAKPSTTSTTTANEHMIDADTSAVTSTATAADIASGVDEISSGAKHDYSEMWLIIGGSAGTTLIFVMLSTILLYVFYKLRKLKQETDSLNHEIKDKSKQAQLFDHMVMAMGADDEFAINSNTALMRYNTGVTTHSNSQMTGDDEHSQKILKRSTATSVESHATPRPPPRRHPLPLAQPALNAENDEKHLFSLDYSINAAQQQLYQAQQYQHNLMLMQQHHQHQQQQMMHQQQQQQMQHANRYSPHMPSRDNSSELYRSYQGIVEIEGNETHLPIIDYDLDDLHVLHDMDTTTRAGGGKDGELSMSHTHYKNESNTCPMNNHAFKRAMDVAAIDEDDIGVDVTQYQPKFPEMSAFEQKNGSAEESNEPSKEETSTSSPSFTIKSVDDNDDDDDDEQKVDLELDLHLQTVVQQQQQQHPHMHLKYDRLISPTNGVSPQSVEHEPGTPQNYDPGSPYPQFKQAQNAVQKDSEQILHSLSSLHSVPDPSECNAKQLELSIDTPPGHGLSSLSTKLPKPKTKGQWM